MATQWSVIANRKDKRGQKVWTEFRVDAVAAGGCPAQAGALVLLDSCGKIDSSLLPALPSSSCCIELEVNGVKVPDQNVLNFIPQNNIEITYGNAGEVYFNVVGTPSSCATYLCTPSGCAIDVGISAPTHPGMMLISQPGNCSAVWADPQVQGLYPAGSTICPAPAYVEPTCIQPIGIGIQDPNGDLRWLQGSYFGSPSTIALDVNVVNPLTVEFPSEIEVTQATTPWVVVGSADVVSTANSSNVPLEASTTIGSVKISGGVLTITAGSDLITTDQVNLSIGQTVYLSGLSYATFLNGTYVTVTSLVGLRQFTATPPTDSPALYGDTYDTGSAAPSNAVFIGSTVDLSNGVAITKITVQVTSDQSSGFDGFQLQYSPDNVNWDHVQSATLTSGNTANMQGGVFAKYVRVLYVNGSVAQTYFRLQTILSPQSMCPTVKNLELLTQADDCAIVARSVLTGRTLPGGSRYTDVITDVYGSLQTVVGGQAAV